MNLAVFYIANLSNTDLRFYFGIIDVVKLPNAQEMARNGRDDRTSQMTKMPDPPPTESEEAPQRVNVRVQNLNEPLPIDDGLDFDKVER